MKQEINPQESIRANAFNNWMSSPMPMVTLVKTIPYSDDLQQFNSDYQRLTALAARECESTFLEDHMIIGTSTLVQTEIDCIVNQYSGKFNNPFLAWARYRKGWLKITLPLSFQFHHVQMDGAHAAKFLQRLQEEIKNLK
jgi:chloramphenicol O-acetyltransferase type A